MFPDSSNHKAYDVPGFHTVSPDSCGFLRRNEALGDDLLPARHQVAGLLQRWLLGTHQGVVGHGHLDYYLDEFTFRFNRRTSKSRGQLFYRLLQRAVAIPPTTVVQIVQQGKSPKYKI